MAIKNNPLVVNIVNTEDPWNEDISKLVEWLTKMKGMLGKLRFTTEMYTHIYKNSGNFVCWLGLRFTVLKEGSREFKIRQRTTVFVRLLRDDPYSSMEESRPTGCCLLPTSPTTRVELSGHVFCVIFPLYFQQYFTFIDTIKEIFSLLVS